MKKRKKKQRVKGKVLKKMVKGNVCYFCGTTENLTEHHLVFKSVMTILKQLLGVEIKTKKEHLCEECHEKYHKLANPVVDLLVSVVEQLVVHIQKLQPKPMRKIGFRITNNIKGGKKG